MDSSNTRLHWVQQNRTKPDRMHTGGALAAKLFSALGADHKSRGASIRELIDADVDDEFRQHCRVVGIREGALYVRVDTPSMVYRMRIQWGRRLLQLANAGRSRRRVWRVFFDYDTDGFSKPSATT